MANNHDVLSCRKCFYLRVLAFVFWSLGIIFLTLLPNLQSQLFFRGQDKVLHAGAYFLAAWLACRCLQIFKFNIQKSVFLSIIYCTVLGAVLEVLQAVMTETRHPELLDLGANFIGTILGCAVFCLQAILISRRNET